MFSTIILIALYILVGHEVVRTNHKYVYGNEFPKYDRAFVFAVIAFPIILFFVLTFKTVDYIESKMG